MRFFRPYVVAKTVFLMPFMGDFIYTNYLVLSNIFTWDDSPDKFQLKCRDKNWLYNQFFLCYRHLCIHG